MTFDLDVEEEAPNSEIYPSPQNGLSSLKHPVIVAKSGTAASTCITGNVVARCLCMFLSGRFFKKWRLLKKRFKQLPLFRL